LKKSRFTESQIVVVLKEGETGMPVAELCRKHNISNATYYPWKSTYSGVQVSELQRLRELEAENARLKHVRGSGTGEFRDQGRSDRKS
jgi:putative transposase